MWALGWTRARDKRPVFKGVLKIGQRGRQELRVPALTMPLTPTFPVLGCSLILTRTGRSLILPM